MILDNSDEGGDRRKQRSLIHQPKKHSPKSENVVILCAYSGGGGEIECKQTGNENAIKS
jgi:hypothetical protein